VLKNNGLSIKPEIWPVLFRFAEKDGTVDYKLLLEVFKQRIQKIDSYPVGRT